MGLFFGKYLKVALYYFEDVDLHCKIIVYNEIIQNNGFGSLISHSFQSFSPPTCCHFQCFFVSISIYILYTF